MAEDTRESNLPVAELTQSNNPQEPSQRKPKYEAPKSQVGKLWDAFGNPEDQANMLPGTVSNSKKEEATVTEAMKSLSTKDLTTFYKMPCARDALMLGIGVAFGVGGIRAILGGMRSLWTASNWAVGTFAITSLGSHEFCQRRRVQELDGMKQAVELMHQLKVKKQREKEQKLEEAAHLAEEKRRKSWTNPSNYKFW
ncbi:COX20 family protein [Aspergillus ruber CBS 135680]|uniref:Cytochrome c oxidase assembly protein COX20, mitochondrial n=1 Tax=Aspergillus ruber (strain CBS 135680) TaxID=1388766 RepID=A0A017SMI7_ASPRC|nr:cytochrome oxidase biogenesis protein, Cox20 subunit [Aspergillus ruber CBS 135680]EYE98188.1 cytochrome oxidase biogenesis protein, Cox20 subunit [Aspergillus ruber CBS 135680]